MKFRFVSTWALLMALAVSLSVTPFGQTGSTASEDRNSDGQADVWQFYDEDGELVKVLRDRNFDGYVDIREVLERSRVVSRTLDQNFDHRFDPGFTRRLVSEPDVTFSLASLPFLLPRAVFVGDHLIEDPAPITRDSSSQRGAVAIVCGRAPPPAL